MAPGIRWVTGFLDTPAARSAAAEAFWFAATGTHPSTRRGDGVFVTLLPPTGDACWRAQVTRSGPAGVHVDLHVEDVPAWSAAATRHGATVVHREPGLDVLRSPHGMPFCLVEWEGERETPPPVRLGASLARLDQVCLDIPAGVYDAEVAFWSVLTGWSVRQGVLPEFSWMPGGDGQPVRLLLQRTEKSGDQVSAHVDLAAGPTMDDVAVAVQEHLRLGATAGPRLDHWQVMTDPAGRTYCLTMREPASGRLLSR
ncbi:VOC family protein [Luteipulveratus flavus]|uniref:VOC family protein n=1 Tax=Luteipulveratus flavus TaxID=3031728 RepID=A0ABT6CAW1_9MICO|nr:VOC family protein [Luteipulveratus sp. YIM 133296]MDF8264416.1 VOC family protein [Luteipulveratus sp. YIM 133296]